MILTPKTTNVAYRCPECGYVIRGLAGAFGLGARDMLRLKCTCGAEPEMTMIGTADERVRLTVPCLLCAHDHHYTVSRSLFYSKDISILPALIPTRASAFSGGMRRCFRRRSTRAPRI